jgi:hypothetical protein
MPGLSVPETVALFEKRSGNSELLEQADIMAAHEMTEGHPFWLDL